MFNDECLMTERQGRASSGDAPTLRGIERWGRGGARRLRPASAAEGPGFLQEVTQGNESGGAVRQRDCDDVVLYGGNEGLNEGNRINLGVCVGSGFLGAAP